MTHSLYLTTFTLLLLTCCLFSASHALADGGYLFATFKGEKTPLTEQIYFVISEDGRTWTELKGGKPVLVSPLGEKGVRDPYLLRSADGKTFFLIATDLSIHLNRDWKRAVRAGSRSIVVWESADLVTWSEPRLVQVAPDDAGCTWAPEAVYDAQAGDYLVFWASTSKADDFKKHRIWAARTKDFKTFSPPFVYIDKPTSVIDTTIVHDGRSYFRFSKDEQFKAVTMEQGPALTGPWQDMPGFSLAKLQGYEGPECYALRPTTPTEPTRWCLVMDHYAKGEGYAAWISTDLSTGHFTPGPDFVFPFKMRHGSILPVSQAELSRLRSTYR